MLRSGHFWNCWLLHAGVEKAVEHEVASGGVKGLFDPTNLPSRYKAGLSEGLKGLEGKDPLQHSRYS
jgi:hypothetical protein